MMSADESDEEYQEDASLDTNPLQSPTRTTKALQTRALSGTSTSYYPLRDSQETSTNVGEFSIDDDSFQRVASTHSEDLNEVVENSSQTTTHAILDMNQDDESLKVDSNTNNSNKNKTAPAKAGVKHSASGNPSTHVDVSRPNSRLSDDGSMTMADQLQEAAGTHLIGHSSGVDGSNNSGTVDSSGSRNRQLLDDVRNSSTRKQAIQQRLKELSALTDSGEGSNGSLGNTQQHTAVDTNGLDDRPETEMGPQAQTNAPSLSRAHSNVNISVSNPTQVGEGLRAYVAYDVRSRHGTVQRRYNDFVWLHTQLKESCPGLILPALPDKQPLGRFESDFVDKRCVMLDAYLCRIAAHPDLGRAGAFLEFCTTLKALPSISAGSAVVDSAAGVELARFLGNIGTAIAATTGLSLSAVTGDGVMGAQQTGETGSEDTDRWFEQKASSNANIVTCLTNVHNALSNLLKCDLEQGRAYVLLARSFQSSALQEIDVRLIKKINHLSQIHEGLRANYQELSSKSEKFETVLKEHIGMADALNTLFKNRAQLIRKYGDARKALIVQRQNTTRSANTANEDPGAAENSLDEAEKQADSLKQQLAHLSVTVKKEAVHLEDERATDLCMGMLAYARMRVEVQRQIVDAWAKCKGAVHEAEHGSAATPSPTPLTS